MITLVSRPRKVVDTGKVSNWVGAFNPVIYEFKREDLPVVDTQVASGGFLQINLGDDITDEFYCQLTQLTYRLFYSHENSICKWMTTM